MPSLCKIVVPPAHEVYLQKRQKFQFNPTHASIICFDHNDLFIGLSDRTYPLVARKVLGPFTAPSVDTSIKYNVVPPDEQCTVKAKARIVKVIHVGSTRTKKSRSGSSKTAKPKRTERALPI